MAKSATGEAEHILAVYDSHRALLMGDIALSDACLRYFIASELHRNCIETLKH
jgi:hypothetical protein